MVDSNKLNDSEMQCIHYCHTTDRHANRTKNSPIPLKSDKPLHPRPSNSIERQLLLVCTSQIVAAILNGWFEGIYIGFVLTHHMPCVLFITTLRHDFFLACRGSERKVHNG
jgi:hypothetical protein